MTIGDWRETPFPTKSTPATQNGIVPSIPEPEEAGPQSVRITADPVLMADAPQGFNMDITPHSGPEDGAGSIGQDVDGWHPAKDGG